MIPKNIYTYFQNFNTDKTANGMACFYDIIDKNDDAIINLDKIDTFFAIVSDIYTNIIENGFLSINYENILFESRRTTIFFITGLKCLKNAAATFNIDIILEFLLLLEYQDSEPSYHELFEMTLLKKIIPLIANQDKKSVQKYLDIVGQFGSHEIREEQFRKFDKYLQNQK
jgi:hypothetical protein